MRVVFESTLFEDLVIRKVSLDLFLIRVLFKKEVRFFSKCFVSNFYVSGCSKGANLTRTNSVDWIPPFMLHFDFVKN